MWAIVHHVPYDSSGGIGTALRRRGLLVVHLRPYLGDLLPEVEELSGLVVLGGPSGKADDDVGHLRAERALLAAAAHAGLPVLGVCFGAQLLAVALGGAVRRAATPEVGIGEVRLTAEGAADPILGPLGPRITVQHWHADEYRLPPEAVRLATSASCDEQAFRWRTKTYGVQFHVELNRDLADVIRPQLGDVVLDPRGVEAASSAGARFADAFLDTGSRD
ncbi:MAG: type 1 glutamine amidotransferase [Patulibacter sp.]